MNPMAHIVIIDSELSLHKIVGGVCEKMGHQVSLHLTARAGIAAIIQEKPDLVITQWRLPDSDGLQIIRECRAIHPAAKVIILTGNPVVDTKAAAMELGAADYITMPFELDDLENAVRRALANSDQTSP